MADRGNRQDVPEILQPDNLPPEFQALNPDAQAEIDSGAVNDLGNGPGDVEAAGNAPPVKSLAWMRDFEPPSAEDGVPAELRDTPQSGLTSEEPIFEDERPQLHRQSGVSPGNAESEDFDWEHPYGG